MKSVLSLLFAFFSVEYLSSQDSTFVIDAGQKVNDVIPAKDVYQYPEFLLGQVFFRDGSISQGKMNYSRLMDEMLFIDEKGDTLALDNEPTIKFVRIDKDTFYFDQGFIMLVKSNNIVRLGIRQGFRVADKRKAAAYDMTSSTSSVSSLSSFYDRNKSYQLAVKEQTVFSKFTDYYFGDKHNNFFSASIKNLVDVFPACSSQLKTFIKKNHIDFTQRNDLERLIYFLESTCQ